MKITTTRAALELQLLAFLKQGKSIGFIPTMGALHEGHLALVKQSVRENDSTVCSIFVNPLQFNNPEDLEKYPKTFDQDRLWLEEEGCDFLFTPDADSFYEGVDQKEYDFGHLGKDMEGKYRPGHFQGVATVVRELFKVVRPTNAYFGEKDYQQLAIVKWMTQKENLKTNVIKYPTVRNDSGLALSSRNLRLSEEGVDMASKIYEVMNYCRNNKENLSPPELVKEASTHLSKDFTLEYLKIVEEESLEEHQQWNDGCAYRVFIAAYLEGIRLIDNLSLNH